MLDRIGGGLANARLSRGVPIGHVIFVPQVSVNWLSRKLGNYDYGVPAATATAVRPAYDLGSTISYEFGVGALIELTENWQVVATVAGERLDNDVVASTIVAERNVVKGFALISYIF